MRDFRLRSLNRNFYSDFPGVSLYLQCTVFIVFINEKPDEFRNFSENSIRSRLIFILQTNLSQYYIRSLHVEHLNEILFSPFGKLCNRIEIKFSWNFDLLAWFSRTSQIFIFFFFFFYLLEALAIIFLFSLKTNIILDKSKYLIDQNF